MPTRIRLQRHGKKGKPFFHIVVADGRAKRDGKFIEKLGTYNPNTNPATIDLDFDRSVYWVSNGAQASDTARAILSYKGVLMKEHLMRGVTKGALTEEQMEAKFQKWMEDKSGKIESKVKSLDSAKAKAEQERLAAEKEVNEARAAAIAAANAPEEVVEEAPAEDGTPEAAATEQVAEGAEQAAEAVEEVAEAAAEKVEEVVEEVKEVAAEVAEKAKEVVEDAKEAVKEAVSGDVDKEEEKKEA